MRQEEWAIDTDDGYKIYGISDLASHQGHADKCLVLVHGLSGHANEYHIKTAANFFVSKGYDVIRFHLYSSENQGRNIKNCTLQTHAADLNAVLAHKANIYSKLYIAGHSYGGPTIMTAQPEKAAALSLWDPSFDFPKLFKDRSDFVYQDDFIIWSGAIDKILGKAFMHEALTRYDAKECLSLSKSLSGVPIQVLTAEDCIYVDDKYSWHSAGHAMNERHIIKGADHCFYRGNTLNDVLELSYQWFEKF